jgi:hypothetical protein
MSKNLEGTDFGKEDIVFYLEERPETDGERFKKIYELIRDEAARRRSSDKVKLVELNLDTSEISRRTGLGPNVVKTKIDELRRYGVLDFKRTCGGTVFYFEFGEKSSYIDRKLRELAKK